MSLKLDVFVQTFSNNECTPQEFVFFISTRWKRVVSWGLRINSRLTENNHQGTAVTISRTVPFGKSSYWRSKGLNLDDICIDIEAWGILGFFKELRVSPALLSPAPPSQPSWEGRERHLLEELGTKSVGLGWCWHRVHSCLIWKESPHWLVFSAPESWLSTFSHQCELPVECIILLPVMFRKFSWSLNVLI